MVYKSPLVIEHLWQKSGHISFPDIKVGGVFWNTAQFFAYDVFLSLLIALAYFEPFPSFVQARCLAGGFFSDQKAAM